jgi:hypothetical protein
MRRFGEFKFRNRKEGEGWEWFEAYKVSGKLLDFWRSVSLDEDYYTKWEELCKRDGVSYLREEQKSQILIRLERMGINVTPYKEGLQGTWISIRCFKQLMVEYIGNKVRNYGELGTVAQFFGLKEKTSDMVKLEAEGHIRITADGIEVFCCGELENLKKLKEKFSGEQ